MSSKSNTDSNPNPKPKFRHTVIQFFVQLTVAQLAQSPDDRMQTNATKWKSQTMAFLARYDDDDDDNADDGDDDKHLLFRRNRKTCKM